MAWFFREIRDVTASREREEKETWRKWKERTVGSDIAHGVRPVLFVLRRAVVLAQLTREVPQDGVALR